MAEPEELILEGAHFATRVALVATLLRERQNAAMAKWVKDTKKDFEKKIHYQVGYTPPKTTTSGSTTG